MDINYAGLCSDFVDEASNTDVICIFNIWITDQEGSIELRGRNTSRDIKCPNGGSTIAFAFFVAVG
mgnify:CR=1 FL=1